ncbi:hypothetical protein FSB65_32595 [Paraburkholderia sp. JPY418]|nr:hypothetical protein [Paraburkholderia youngii]
MALDCRLAILAGEPCDRATVEITDAIRVWLPYQCPLLQPLPTCAHSIGLAATGRAASARSSNSSPESGQWNSASRKRPVGSANSRPARAVRSSTNATASWQVQGPWRRGVGR